MIKETRAVNTNRHVYKVNSNKRDDIGYRSAGLAGLGHLLVMTTITHSDMQWIFVHHLLRNETVLRGSGLLSCLQRSNAYFEELSRLQQETSHTNDGQNTVVGGDEQHAGGDTILSAELFEGTELLKKVEQIRNKAKSEQVKSARLELFTGLAAWLHITGAALE
ncbi:hypothetical protein GCK32_017877 [Trichostrongylus colubriformis]|uniref:Uncharacterized protein n=1 Tax=Trichostrongylus colubriformis TaxID=6319 RepID=A0AAN8FN65_TRICO